MGKSLIPTQSPRARFRQWDAQSAKSQRRQRPHIAADSRTPAQARPPAELPSVSRPRLKPTQVPPPASAPDRPHAAARYSRVMVRRSGRAAPLRLPPLAARSAQPRPLAPPEPSEPAPAAAVPYATSLAADVTAPRGSGPINGMRAAVPAP